MHLVSFEFNVPERRGLQARDFQELGQREGEEMIVINRLERRALK